MLLFNLAHTVANLAAYASRYGEAPRGVAELRGAFLRAVARSQGSRFPDGDVAALGWGEDPRGEIPNLAEFGHVRPLPVARREPTMHAVSDALVELHRVDPALHRFFQLQVGAVEVVEGELYGAISGPRFLGGVTVLPQDTWDTRRWVETLIHEAMHLNVYTADAVRGLYTHPTAPFDGTVLSPSAIRIGEERTLNGAFHSACVALLLVWVRHRYGDAEAVGTTIAELQTCAEGLAGRREWFSAYGQAALDPLLAFARAPVPEQLGATLRAKLEVRVPVAA